MVDIPDDILDINETDPLRIILAIDKKLRPTLTDINDANHVESVLHYYRSIDHACRRFGISFDVDEPENDSFSAARDLYFATKSAIDKKKIDLLHRQLTSETSIRLDESWRGKIHSYLANIRGIVERETMDAAIREKILKSLNELAKDIDSYRAPLQKFTDVFVGLCEGISSGATALTPAVRVLERIIGAIERLKSAKPRPLALPKPEDLGLPEPDSVPELPPPRPSSKR